MQYYLKQFFVSHSLEVIFSVLIKKSRQKAIEIEIEFFHPLGNPRGRTLDHFFYASHICHKFPCKLSFRSEASADGLTCSCDGNNHRTCHITIYCFSLKMRCIFGNTQEFFVCSLSRLSPVVNRNGRKGGGQH